MDDTQKRAADFVAREGDLILPGGRRLSDLLAGLIREAVVAEREIALKTARAELAADYITGHLTGKLAEHVRAEERERCAELAWELAGDCNPDNVWKLGREIAAAIREGKS